MADSPFRNVVRDEDELRRLIGLPRELALRKQISALDDHCRAFIAHSPFVLLATADGAGRCDVSPRGDRPGFVLVLDDTHLMVPDRPGNRRLDSMHNILQNPHLGLIFMIPAVDETLRVNGRASIVRDAELLERAAAQGKVPVLGLGVEVEECFLQCAKALRRSALWQPSAWPDLSALPRRAQMFLDHARPEGKSVEELERDLEAGYREHLY